MIISYILSYAFTAYQQWDMYSPLNSLMTARY